MAYPYEHRLETRVLSKYFGDWDAVRIDGWIARGGYKTLKKALKMSQDDIIQVVKDSGLRGRGGAGFPAGLKWSFMPKDGKVPNYLACNADESEPGTFKDRELLESNPHQVIEGALIAAYAIQATAVYIYCRGEFWDLAHELEDRIQEAVDANLAGENILGSGWSCPVYVHLGAGASLLQ